ncbi:MAG: DUF309 domain-containing protein [Aigarchaeota archaeon]|nr:DUF309 domain-containing protein [Candidatus Pelearchaeum maunauluense]
MEGHVRRYLVITKNNAHLTPRDRGGVISELRERLRDSCRVADLRIASNHLEFDLFCGEHGLERTVSILNGLFGVVDVRNLSDEKDVMDFDEALIRAVGLFNEERYWEAHEALENLWRNTQGAEKELLHGIILTAAAYVHTQKGEEDRFIPILERAYKSLLSWPEDSYRGIDVKALREAVKRLHDELAFHRITLTLKY